MSAWVNPDYVREVHDGGITYRKRADVIDDIDALVDAQLQQEPSGYDHNINQDECPRCGRHWHGLPLSEQVVLMYRYGEYNPDYVAAADDSPIVCEGPDFIGPLRPLTEKLAKLEQPRGHADISDSYDSILNPQPGALWVIPDVVYGATLSAPPPDFWEGWQELGYIGEEGIESAPREDVQIVQWGGGTVRTVQRRDVQWTVTIGDQSDARPADE